MSTRPFRFGLQLAPDAATAVASAQALWNLYVNDVVREMYMREDNRGMVFVAEGASPEAVAQALATIPWVKSGLVTGEGIRMMPFRDLATAFAAPARAA